MMNKIINMILCRHPRDHHRRAAASIEFAVSMSVLTFFVMAGIEFFRVSMIRHHADNAAYEAARAAIFPGASNADAVTAANNYLSLIGVTPASIKISPNPIDQNTAHLQVEVSIAMDDNSWGVGSFMAGKTLVGRCRLMTERAPVLLANAMPVPPPPPPPLVSPPLQVTPPGPPVVVPPPVGPPPPPPPPPPPIPML